MTLRDDLLPVFDRTARTIPDGFGLRTTRVILRTRTWDAGEVGLGEATDVDLELDPRPKVRELGPGTVRVGPITPDYAAGGYTPAQLFPDDTLAAGVERFWVLIGIDAIEERFRVHSINSRRAFGVTFELQSLDRPDPRF